MSDIDIVYLTGYGFPPWREGPMRYADVISIFNILQSTRRFAEGPNGDACRPVALLVELAGNGQRPSYVAR